MLGTRKRAVKTLAVFQPALDRQRQKIRSRIGGSSGTRSDHTARSDPLQTAALGPDTVSAQMDG